MENDLKSLRQHNLQRLIDELCKGNQSDFSKIVGKSPSQLSDMLTGKKSFGEKVARDIEKNTGKPSGWLSQSHAHRVSEPQAAYLVEKSPPKLDNNVSEINVGQYTVPIVDYVQAGVFAEICDPYAMGGGFEFIAASGPVSRCSFALKISGKSMLPEFSEGDIVIIDPAESPRPGDFVVAKNGEEKATFKKYRPRGHNEKGIEIIELVPLNEDYPTLRSDITPFHIIGTMVEHRKFRRRS